MTEKVILPPPTLAVNSNNNFRNKIITFDENEF